MNIAKWASYGIFLFCLVEIPSVVYFQANLKKFLWSQPENYTLDLDYILKAKSIFHPDLGWIERHESKYNERPRHKKFKKDLAITVGGSSNFGEGVVHDQTWQESLSKLSRKSVFNFGVSGYGMGQALQMYTQKKDLFSFEYALFTFSSRDLIKTVNTYRKFIHRIDGGLFLTKPRYILNLDKTLKLLPNPIKKEEDLLLLSDANFISSLSKDDWWHQSYRLSRFGFPFSFTLFNPDFWAINFFAQEAPWRESENIDLVAAIWKEFSKQASEVGSRPIIMQFPSYQEFKKLQQLDFDLSKSMVYQKVMMICKQNKLNCLFPIEYLKDYKISVLFQGKGREATLSPIGHELLAEYLFMKLEPKKRNLAKIFIGY